ncbi:hypothetical protein LTR17_020595 [Elasticomyces elasticus]|nr:hypothetical protein LTR17_020595 [Elasticomyces elasticus]
MYTQCKVLTVPDSAWDFCPNSGANWVFVALFGLTTIAHFVQMVLYRKIYSLVITISGILQTVAYVIRGLSIIDPTLGMYTIMWFILMMIAPLFTNAYAYMIVGRMVYVRFPQQEDFLGQSTHISQNFTPTASVLKIKAWRFGRIFVSLDVVAFFMQTGGAGVAVSQQGVLQTTGIDIYMGGIAFQQVCIFAFLFLAGKLHRDMLQQPTCPERKSALQLIYTQYAVVALITVRIIFRLVEYSSGFDSAIPRQEAYQ